MKTELQQAYADRVKAVMDSPFRRWCVEKKKMDIHCAFYTLNDPYPNAVALREEYRKETGLSC